MNRKSCEKYAKRPALWLAALALAASPSFAQAIDLCATTGTAAMPDATSVNIWGYVEGNCTGGSAGKATLPGPELRTTAGGTLTIDLYTDLPFPVSFFAPGLRADGAPPAGKFTQEATVDTPASYTFSNIKAGTYLYHSGSYINTQVPMGLYGALVVDVAPGQAYDDVSYVQDEVLVYSEIDPKLNDGTNADARVINWFPQYFLINGKAYPNTGPIGVGTSQSTLLRFVNAGLDTVVPTFDGGLYMDLKAEDGNRYPQPFTQYGIELPAGKTIDAIVSPGTDGAYKLYDRALHAGMMTSLQSGPAAEVPIAVDDPEIAAEYTIDEDAVGGLVVAAPGVLGNDTSALPLSAVLVSGTANGTLDLAGDGSFTYTPNANFNGFDSFTYKAYDGTLFSDPATATITVTAVNDAPVAAADSYNEEEGIALNVAAPGVLANDVDVDGDVLTATLASGPVVSFDAVPLGATAGTVTLNPDGSFTHDPTGTGLNAGDQVEFVYEACDAAFPCSTATVTITVTAVNVAPTAADDGPYVTDQDVPFSVAAPGILGNDSDPNSDPLTVALVGNVANGSLTLYTDGGFDYTPGAGFNGSDSFTYFANDGALDSNVATVSITVNLVNDIPFAANDFAAVARNSSAADAANTFSVITNDVDSNGIDAASVVITSGAIASRGGTVVNNGDGTVTFIPKRGFRGTDTFTYTVKDNLGAVSNVATVRVNVN